MGCVSTRPSSCGSAVDGTVMKEHSDIKPWPKPPNTTEVRNHKRQKQNGRSALESKHWLKWK